jgi:type II secretory pathway component PulJ
LPLFFRKKNIMKKHVLQYPGRDTGEYPPRYEIGYYDVEKSLESRYQRRQALSAWRDKLLASGDWLARLEQLFHLHPIRPHPKPVMIHRRHHR